jgi:hypothetical protein
MPEDIERLPEDIERPILGVLTLSSLQLPEVVEWVDGTEYTVQAKVIQRNKREEEDLTTADFEIVEIAAVAEEE